MERNPQIALHDSNDRPVVDGFLVNATAERVVMPKIVVGPLSLRPNDELEVVISTEPPSPIAAAWTAQLPQIPGGRKPHLARSQDLTAVLKGPFASGRFVIAVQLSAGGHRVTEVRRTMDVVGVQEEPVDHHQPAPRASVRIDQPASEDEETAAAAHPFVGIVSLDYGTSSTAAVYYRSQGVPRLDGLLSEHLAFLSRELPMFVSDESIEPYSWHLEDPRGIAGLVEVEKELARTGGDPDATRRLHEFYRGMLHVPITSSLGLGVFDLTHRRVAPEGTDGSAPSIVAASGTAWLHGDAVTPEVERSPGTTVHRGLKRRISPTMREDQHEALRRYLAYVHDSVKHAINTTRGLRVGGEAELDAVVVTYPVMTREGERSKYAELLQSAGFTTITREYDEATAAAVYYLQRQIQGSYSVGFEAFWNRCDRLDRDGLRRVHHALVIDIGGGTADIALLRLEIIDDTALQELPRGTRQDDSLRDRRGARSYLIKPQVLGLEGLLHRGGDRITLKLFLYLKLQRARRSGAQQRDLVALAATPVEQLLPHIEDKMKASRAEDKMNMLPAPEAEGLEEAAAEELERLVSTAWNRADATADARRLFLDLWHQAERCKIAYAENPIRYDEPDLPGEVIEAAARSVAADVAEAALEIAQRHLGGAQLDQVVLSGRPTTMAAVSDVITDRLEGIAGWERYALTRYRSDEAKSAVALGACYAEYLDLAQRTNPAATVRAGKTHVRVDVRSINSRLTTQFRYAVDHADDLFNLSHDHSLFRPRQRALRAGVPERVVRSRTEPYAVMNTVITRKGVRNNDRPWAETKLKSKLAPDVLELYRYELTSHVIVDSRMACSLGLSNGQPCLDPAASIHLAAGSLRAGVGELPGDEIPDADLLNEHAGETFAGEHDDGSLRLRYPVEFHAAGPGDLEGGGFDTLLARLTEFDDRARIDGEILRVAVRELQPGELAEERGTGEVRLKVGPYHATLDLRPLVDGERLAKLNGLTRWLMVSEAGHVFVSLGAYDYHRFADGEVPQLDWPEGCVFEFALSTPDLDPEVEALDPFSGQH